MQKMTIYFRRDEIMNGITSHAKKSCEKMSRENVSGTRKPIQTHHTKTHTVTFVSAVASQPVSNGDKFAGDVMNARLKETTRTLTLELEPYSRTMHMKGKTR